MKRKLACAGQRRLLPRAWAPAVSRISKAEIRRLGRRAHVKRIAGVVYDEVRDALRQYVSRLVGSARLYMEHARRNTITPMDIAHALKRHGHTVYGLHGAH